MKLVFAQGNPGPDYNNSRHNVGFVVLDTLAASLGAVWVDRPKFHARIAEVAINGEKTIFVKPTTYYNETGISARQIIDFYKINRSDDLLVIHDDIDLPFGTIRVRKQGSDAGNNGIKSLNAHLGPDYVRIRIGTNNELRPQIGEVAFVLAKFSVDEIQKLHDNIIPQVIELIHLFCAGNLKSVSHKNLDK